MSGNKLIVGLLCLVHHLLIGQSGFLDLSFSQDGRQQIAFDGSSGAHDPSCIAVQSDGKVLVAGNGFHLAGISVSHICITRLLADGTPDPSFSGDGREGYLLNSNLGNHFPRAVSVLNDGKILVLLNANSEIYLLRILSNGQADDSFGSKGFLKLNRPAPSTGDFLSHQQMIVQSDGKIIVFFRQRNNNLGAVMVFIVRLNSNGTFDSTFGKAGTVVVDSSSIKSNRSFSFDDPVITLGPAGKLFVAGDSVLNNDPSNLLIKVYAFKNNGESDSSFGLKGRTQLTGPALQPTGITVDLNQNVYVSGNIRGVIAVLKLKSNGVQDASYGLNGLATGGVSFIPISNSLRLIQDQTIFAGLVSDGTNFKSAIKSFDAKGFPNSSFGINGFVELPQIGMENIPRAMEVQSDRKILLVCKRKNDSSVNNSEFEVARFNGPIGVSVKDFQITKIHSQSITSDKLYIELEDGILVKSIWITDISSGFFKSMNPGTDQSFFDVSDLPAGSYVAIFHLSNGLTFSVKFLKI